jgi:hypothetical protein
VCYISWVADICCVCGDAGGRFRDGCHVMEEPHLEAGIGDGELIDWSGGDGSRWVSVFFFLLNMTSPDPVPLSNVLTNATECKFSLGNSIVSGELTHAFHSWH